MFLYEIKRAVLYGFSKTLILSFIIVYFCVRPNISYTENYISEHAAEIVNITEVQNTIREAGFYHVVHIGSASHGSTVRVCDMIPSDIYRQMTNDNFIVRAVSGSSAGTLSGWGLESVSINYAASWNYIPSTGILYVYSGTFSASNSVPASTSGHGSCDVWMYY